MFYAIGEHKNVVVEELRNEIILGDGQRWTGVIAHRDLQVHVYITDKPNGGGNIVASTVLPEFSTSAEAKTCIADWLRDNL